MYQKIFLIIILIISLSNCSKKETVITEPPNENKAYEIYKEALDAMNKNEFFFAAKKFAEAEKILPVIEHSAKAQLMSGFCFYAISFHDEAISALENFLKKYPADKNVDYASYLIALSNYEQILDEKKRLEAFN